MNTKRESDRIETKNLTINYDRQRAYIRGRGRNSGESVEKIYSFYTLWTQGKSTALPEQHAEQTDQEIIEKIWRELKAIINSNSGLWDIEKIATKHGIMIFKTELMRG